MQGCECLLNPPAEYLALSCLKQMEPVPSVSSVSCASCLLRFRPVTRRGLRSFEVLRDVHPDIRLTICNLSGSLGVFCGLAVFLSARHAPKRTHGRPFEGRLAAIAARAEEESSNASTASKALVFGRQTRFWRSLDVRRWTTGLQQPIILKPEEAEEEETIILKKEKAPGLIVLCCGEGYCHGFLGFFLHTSEVTEFQEDGVVLLRGVLKNWVLRLDKQGLKPFLPLPLLLRCPT